MQHPDIALLNTWLDGELPAVEVAELDAHLAACPACAARAREQRALLTESDALLAALDEPMTDTAGGTERTTSAARPADHGSPVVLLPYNEMLRWHRSGWHRSGWRRGLGIAAALIVTAGAGWMALRPDAPGGRAATDLLSNAQSPVASTPVPAAVAVESASGPSLADSGGPALLATDAPPAGRAPDPGAKTTVAVREDAAARKSAARPAVPTPSAAGSPQFAEPDVKPLALMRETQPAAASSTFKAGISAAAPQRLAEVRALDDREPLDVQRDAQISTRIGLDEARRELGGNLHVIDGLRPELVGLVSGRLMPGADPSRPVVRVVYLDNDGQSFFLDQQRMATNAPARRASTGRMPGMWLDGDVQLRLHGALPDDSLAGLARRVK